MGEELRVQEKLTHGKTKEAPHWTERRSGHTCIVLGWLWGWGWGQEVKSSRVSQEGRRFPPPRGTRSCHSSGVERCVMIRVCVCVYRSLARSHRVCRLGLKREIEGFRKEAAHTRPGLLPCPQGQHRQALEAGFSKRQSSHCPRKWELIRNKDAASYRTTFSHPSPDTQVLFV